MVPGEVEGNPGENLCKQKSNVIIICYIQRSSILLSYEQKQAQNLCIAA